MKILSVVLALCTAASCYAADQSVRVRVALALASARATKVVDPFEDLNRQPDQERWSWYTPGGDFAHLYLDGKYNCSWCYSQKKWVTWNYERKVYVGLEQVQESVPTYQYVSSGRSGGC